MESKTCSSCKIKIVNDKGSVSFKCPQCGDAELVRCTNCRSNAARFNCPSCEFSGPN